jgi:hypothetical protein
MVSVAPIGPWNEIYTGRRWTLPFRHASDRCFGRWRDHSIIVRIWSTPYTEVPTPPVEVTRSGTRYEAVIRHADGRTQTKRYEWRSGQGLTQIGGANDC